MNRRAMEPGSIPKALLRLAAALALGTLSACGGGPAERPPLEGARIGGDFTLVGRDGRPVHFADSAGKYRVLYFGYTFCPDVCPLDVANLMQGYHLFARDDAARAARVVPMFVSIDPARDTPQVVGQFAANFGKELVGLTGTPAQVDAAAKAWAVYYQKRAGASPNDYLMDHSRAAYLMGPDGKPIALLPVDKDARAVAADLAQWVR